MSLIPILNTNPRNHHVYDPFTSLETWDPFCNFGHVKSLSSPPGLSFHNRTIPYSPTNGTRFYWEETAEAHVLRAEVLGLKKEEVKVTVEEGRLLKISGEKKVDKEEKHENWHHLEHGKVKFESVFSLPENAKLDHIKSSFENGVVYVIIPKRDVKKHHAKDLHIN